MMKQFLLSFSMIFTLCISATAQLELMEVAESYPLAQISFDENEFHFGKIPQGEKVGHIFRFTNTGTEPLIISNAKGSCGCTVTNFPKEPVMPGESGAIVMEFDSKSKMGSQTKQITVTANTDPPQSLVYIKGEIFEPLEDSFRSVESETTDAAKPKAVTKVVAHKMTAYPNPASDVLWLKLEETNGQSVNIELYNGSGQLIHKKVLQETGSEPVQLDVSKYESGRYWLSVQVANGVRESLGFVVMRG